MFRSIRWYQFDGAWPDSEERLSELLETGAFKPCGPLTERSNGWETVLPDAGSALARRVNGADLLKLRSQSRILPAAAINEELEQRIDAFRQRTGEEASAAEKRRLKAQARDELLPKAMLKSERIHGYVDYDRRLIAIDSAQEANAERFLRRLNASINGLTVQPLAYREPVEGLLTRILFGDAPRQLAAGTECRMQDLNDSRATVRWSNFDLSDASIRGHVADGMRLTHLAIQYDNVMSGVLDLDGTVTKLKFVGGEADDDSDDALAAFDTAFVLLTGTLRNFAADLDKLLGRARDPLR